MVSSDTFREVTGQFATGVTVVTLEHESGFHGMTVNSFSSVSLDPPLVLFSADIDTKTHDYVAEVEHFAVNILAEDQEELSNRFAGEHHDMDDPFHDVEFTHSVTGAPLFEDGLGYIDCTLHESFPGGDHTIYVGKVEDMEATRGDAQPLTFFRGAYGTIDSSP